jgi:hypothetical protein
MIHDTLKTAHEIELNAKAGKIAAAAVLMQWKCKAGVRPKQ